MESNGKSSFGFFNASGNGLSNNNFMANNQGEIMYENLTPIIVAIIGVFQVALAIYFARRKNEATAEKEEAMATEAIGSTYSTLVQRLEERLVRLEDKYDNLCDEYETDKVTWATERKQLMSEITRLSEAYEEDKAAWAAERKELTSEIERLETMIDAK
jgi:predicted RNase H-like nuclease (RuvC/YqgF family)